MGFWKLGFWGVKLKGPFSHTLDLQKKVRDSSEFSHSIVLTATV